jgi:hypothetical protein
MHHDESNCPIDLQRRYRIADREGLIDALSLSLAEHLAFGSDLVINATLIFREGFQSLHERNDGALLLLAEDHGMIDDLIDSAVLREVDVPPLLEWYEARLSTLEEV